ncbi:MAG TPA: HAMP domain-containing sensor histidine kinase [Solirubrobacteraceae bacterium]|jgi:signal transduction histidine kinase|nr:HAMP domain-containing sensor histidine kinase [Solirubrobacteraceae bacterium]
MQLTLLYAGLFLALCAAVLLVSGQLIGSQSMAAPGFHSSTAPSGPAAPGHHLNVGPALVGIAAVLVALASAWWLAGRLLRPLRAINQTAREISATNLHRRLDLSGPSDEITQLGRTLDDLLARLEASFDSQRHFVANASHELRTPLAGQRTLLQVALADPRASGESLRSACEEALMLSGQQESLIAALLTLANSQGGVEHWESLDLAPLAEAVLLARREQADRCGVHLDVHLEAASAVGDPRLVESLLANLIDNAIRHNASGGRVEISSTAAVEGAAIVVTNSGPLVQPDEVERLFQPFRRTGSDRAGHSHGHGLGLAIVQAIADAHSAEISARARPEGGLAIRVCFNRSAPRPGRLAHEHS